MIFKTFNLSVRELDHDSEKNLQFNERVAETGSCLMACAHEFLFVDIEGNY